MGTKNKKKRKQIHTREPKETGSRMEVIAPEPRSETSALTSSAKDAITTPPLPPISTYFADISKGGRYGENDYLSHLPAPRHKHLRFQENYHGTWLEMPIDCLEAMAHSNGLAPFPLHVHPGVSFDVLKVRKLVQEASDLTVRAAQGDAYSSGAAKLSAQRKFRMRELAVQKLAQAYQLDNLAATVAMSHRTPALATLGEIVLQSNPDHPDAKLVKFLHERVTLLKIPGQSETKLLDEIITSGQGEAALLKLRGLINIIADNPHAAVADLSHALHLCRAEDAQWRPMAKLPSMQPGNGVKEPAILSSQKHDFVTTQKVQESSQPRGLDMHILCHRGVVYLQLACQQLHATLFWIEAGQKSDDTHKSAAKILQDPEAGVGGIHAKLDERTIRCRDQMRRYCQRALRDFNTFLSKLLYSFTLVPYSDMGNACKGSSAHGPSKTPPPKDKGAEKLSAEEQDRVSSCSDRAHFGEHYPLSDLLSPSPPLDLPPFPDLAHRTGSSQREPAVAQSDEKETFRYYFERATFHPLLSEVMHCCLLIHCMLETPKDEIRRYAYNVARISNAADADLLFRVSCMHARQDWTIILELTRNFVGIEYVWSSMLSDCPWEVTRAVVGPFRGETALKKVNKLIAADKDRKSDKPKIIPTKTEAATDFSTSHDAGPQTSKQPRQESSTTYSERFEPFKLLQLDSPRLKDMRVFSARASLISRWIELAPTLRSGHEASYATDKKRKGATEASRLSSPDPSQIPLPSSPVHETQQELE